MSCARIRLSSSEIELSASFKRGTSRRSLPARAQTNLPPYQVSRPPLLGHVALSGDVRRAKERILRSREITRSGLGVAEGEQQTTPDFLVARVHHLEHVESDPEEADALLVRENGRGLLPRSPCIRNGLVDVARPRSLAEVVGKLSQVRLRVLGIQAFQHLADLPMELHAAACGETVVQGFTHERVGEVHATDGAGYLGHDPRADAFIDDLEERSCGDAACPGECVESELPTEDRCECEDWKARRGQKREAATDHLRIRGAIVSGTGNPRLCLRDTPPRPTDGPTRRPTADFPPSLCGRRRSRPPVQGHRRSTRSGGRRPSGRIP